VFCPSNTWRSNDLDQIEGPADIRRHHVAGGANLATQQITPPLVLEEIRQHRLESHLDPELEIKGPPHLAHPTAAELGLDLVAIAQDLTWCEETLGQTFGRGARYGRPLTAVAGSVLWHIWSCNSGRV
jgi:hypothetical protein